MRKAFWDAGKRLVKSMFLLAIFWGGITVTALLVVRHPPNDSASAAAWVQAYGSIGAVIAAIYIMSRQAKAQRDLKLLEKKEALNSAVRLIERASSHIACYLNEPALRDKRMRGIADPIKVWIDVFSSLDITSPALQEIAIHITNIRLQVVTMQSILLAIEDGKTTFDEQEESLAISQKSIKENARKCSEL